MDDQGKDARRGDEVHQCPRNVVKNVVKIIKERLVEAGLTSHPADVEARKREVEFQEMRERQTKLLEAVQELSTMLKK